MTHQYRIDYWIPPKSGFDLVEKEKFITMVESTFDSMEADNASEIQTLKQSFEAFKKEGEGYILESITIESDFSINTLNECENQIMPLIRKKNPLAKLVGCSLISPVNVGKE